MAGLAGTDGRALAQSASAGELRTWQTSVRPCGPTSRVGRHTPSAPTTCTARGSGRAESGGGRALWLLSGLADLALGGNSHSTF